MNIKKIILIASFGVSVGLNAAESILKIVTDRIGRPEEVLELESKQRQARLEDLQKEKAQLEAARPAFLTELQVKTNEIEKKLGAIKQALQLESDNEFLIKVQSTLNDWLQILKEQQKTNDAIVARLDERIAQLNGPHNQSFAEEVISVCPPTYEPALVLMEARPGEGIPVAGAVRAIGTPGHTAGHLVFHWPEDGGVLFVGDAANNVDGLRLSPIYEDPAQGLASLRMLGRLEFETACFAHGPAIVGNGAGAFRRVWGA